MDELLRRLERAAAAGDKEAAERLLNWQRRLRPSYFLIDQNNVMGLWRSVPERGIGRKLIIQAHSNEEAEERLYQIVGETPSGDWCECCGSRWNPSRMEEYPSLDAIREWGQQIAASIPGYWIDTYLHYQNGNFRIWRP